METLGYLVTLVLIAFLVLLHSVDPTVPLNDKLNAPITGTVPLLVCRGEVEWVLDPAVYGPVQELYRPLGLDIQDPKTIDCQAPCYFAQHARWAACRAGAILVTLRDQQFRDNHGGETLLEISNRQIQYGTILLPQHIFHTKPLSEPEIKTLAHEIGHWMGYQHVLTKLAGPLVSIKSGHLMNPDLYRVGYNTRGMDDYRGLVTYQIPSR
jgi:Zn-dependent protease with chaperone function